MVSLFSTSTHVYINTHIHTHTHKHMDTNINHLPHSHCMCVIMNVVFRSTSGECGRPFDVKVIWFKYTFFSASFFPSYHDSATLMAGMEGAATFVRHSILYISVHMWYLNSMGSLHSPRPGYFSYCFVVSQLSFVVYCKPSLSSFICQVSLKKENCAGIMIGTN